MSAARVFRVAVVSVALTLAGMSLIGCRGGADVTEPGERLLKGGEIRKLFNDRTVTGRHLKHGYTFESYYDEGGTFRSHQTGKSAVREGRWWIRGSDICIHWKDDDPPGDLCRKIVQQESGKYLKVKPRRGARLPLVAFETFTPGNPKRL